MKLHKFKNFINELITPKSEFYPETGIEHLNRKNPAFLTFDEYFSELQSGAMKKHHEDGTYDYSIDDDPYSWVDLKKDKWKRIKTVKYGKIVIDYLISSEELQYVKSDENGFPIRDKEGNVVYKSNSMLNAAGKITKDYTIVAYHKDEDVIVGSAQNEWGAMLISVAREYRGIGIGDELEDLSRYYFPHRGTGGVTNAGYNMLRRYYTRLIRKYLANGIYSDMVRKGEMTKERVKEIVNSIDKKRYTKTDNELSKNYGGSGKLMYYLDNNCVIIFDKDIKEALKKPDNGRFTKKLLKCFIYINQFKNNVDYENLFTVYAESDKFLKIGIDMLLSDNIKISDYFLDKRFDDKTKSYISKIFNDDDYLMETDSHYETDHITRIISLKDNKFSFRQMKRDSLKWFKENDQHDEFKNGLMEYAEGVADIIK